MDSYLTDRKLTIVTEEGTIATDLSAGVPQGSIKGPFLWTCMYDGLLRMKLSNGASLVEFADKALELIAEWLISRSLQLTVHKCEAILVTRRRKYEAPRFEINGEVIPLKQEIKYLGVWLDSKWSFKHHVKEATTKTSIACTSLMRLMPNVGGPWQARRQLLATVVESIQLYGVTTWTDCIPAYLVDKHMGTEQRKMNLRIISGWRTLSRDAVNVLSGVPPIRLLALEWKEIRDEEEVYRLRQGHLSEEERDIIRVKARETLFKRWQEEWDSSKDGRWTHKLIPNINEWVLREHGSMEYRLTQGLGGHRCFGKYLAKRGHRPNSNCRLYGEVEVQTPPK